MARYDFRSPRLWVDQPLGPGLEVGLDRARSHYLTGVLRLKPGDRVLVFNGRDGEWRGSLLAAGRHGVALRSEEQTRGQTPAGDLHYAFAPLKRARLDYMVQKAVEMGVSRLQPVITRHTQAERVNVARMRANAVEAAEQCGILTLPEVMEPAALSQALRALDPSRLLVFCDEDADVADPVAALTAARPAAGGKRGVTVLVGPEGGFAEEEREALARRPAVVRLALGPRILRADTAAVAALALVQAVLGDWR
ncbi:MAG TPA: 16S rRNA (uracil(1498)-N(3))-methyltransferase [Xanthobacteraceae bacterium]|nr:16S rRNA (uracil(1498)-N(3))-methyltransferase [Xanthobacteraceae bacterium]